MSRGQPLAPSSPIHSGHAADSFIPFLIKKKLEHTHMQQSQPLQQNKHQHTRALTYTQGYCDSHSPATPSHIHTHRSVCQVSQRPKPEGAKWGLQFTQQHTAAGMGELHSSAHESESHSLTPRKLSRIHSLSVSRVTKSAALTPHSRRLTPSLW